MSVEMSSAVLSCLSVSTARWAIREIRISLHRAHLHPYPFRPALPVLLCEHLNFRFPFFFFLRMHRLVDLLSQCRDICLNLLGSGLSLSNRLAVFTVAFLDSVLFGQNPGSI